MWCDKTSANLCSTIKGKSQLWASNTYRSDVGILATNGTRKSTFIQWCGQLGNWTWNLGYWSQFPQIDRSYHAIYTKREGVFYKFFVFSGCCLRPTSKVLLCAWLSIIPVVTALRSGHQICEVIGKLQIQKESRGSLEIARWLESCRYKKKAEGAWRLWGDWKATDTKRKQRELGDCSIDDVHFQQLLRENERKNSRSWIVFGTPKGKSPKIPTMHKNWTFLTPPKAQIKIYTTTKLT